MKLRPPTGPFTQRDPIGLVGGLNQYGYASGDPIANADPFGLKVCFKGSKAEVQELKEATETATNTSITLDEKNCIKRAVRKNDNHAYRALQVKLFHLIAEPTTYSAQFDTSGRSFSAYNPTDRAAYIVRRHAGSQVYWNDTPLICALTGAGLRHSVLDLPALVTHELLGHATVGQRQDRAIGVENLYHDAAGRMRRCTSAR